jgi:PAS domain S-box-containing protein
MPQLEGSATSLYQLLVESVSDYAIFALDRDGNVVSWNPGAERFMGYKESEIVGKHFSTFYPAEDLANNKPAMELETAARVGRFEDEGWRLRKDGTRFWANVVITALRNKEGTLIGFAKITRDLTERKEAEEKARQLVAETAAHQASEEKNRELKSLTDQLKSKNEELAVALNSAVAARDAATRAESRERQGRARAEQLQQLGAELSVASTTDAVADAVVERARETFDAAGVIVCRVTEAGDELEIVRATDLSNEVLNDWVRMPLSAVAPLSDVVVTGLPVFLESISDWEADYPELLKLTEEVGHQSQMIIPLVAGGRCIGSLGIAFREPRVFTDDDRELATVIAGVCAVSLERARLFEAERAARAVAENANRVKAEFLAAMSHELRTPLNAIAGHVDLLTLEIYGPLGEKQREALMRVKRAQQHLLGLIDDLLSYARIESGKVEYRLGSTSVQTVIADVGPMIEPQISAKSLHYEICVPDETIEVVADREKLIQVLLNLLSNAVKFTSNGGSISVSVRPSKRSNSVDLCVSDTGVGVPPDKMQAIFDPFVQLSTSPSSRHEGTGLGLAISRDLARGMGGDLFVEGDSSKGATFVIVLPLASIAS